MLEQLDIKNFALIDSLSVEFLDGFTVLSGETGAGKSILIGALSFVLGGKAGVEQIRAGETEASVSASFCIKPGTVSPAAFAWLDEHGIELENDRVLLRRYIRSTGKSGAWIQDVQVTRADLSAFSSFLIDIHGQHEHQSLMRVAEHRVFLDNWAGLQQTVADFTRMYAQLVAVQKKLEELRTGQQDRERRIDMLTFAVQEIADAKIQAGEDERLEEEESKLASYEKLYADVEEMSSLLDGEGGIVSLLKKLRGAVSHAGQYDKNLAGTGSRIENSFYELTDIADEIGNYQRSLVFDPERLASVQDRLALLYSLKKKYASSSAAPVAEVLAYKADAEAQLAELTGGAENREALQAQYNSLMKQVYAAAKSLSAQRSAAAVKMSEQIETVLAALGMGSTKFQVCISEKPGTAVEQQCGPYGMDDVEFCISANPGSPLQPLAKIASGGELSRVMLAIKTIFAETDMVPTMIFDEIDTGIGGEVAVAVGSHIKKLAEKRQILCITHLASIAVYADNQIKVEKAVNKGVMQSHIHPVTGERRVEEIARMLSGDPAGAESLEHARSMLEKFSIGKNAEDMHG